MEPNLKFNQPVSVQPKQFSQRRRVSWGKFRDYALVTAGIITIAASVAVVHWSASRNQEQQKFNARDHAIRVFMGQEKLWYKDTSLLKLIRAEKASVLAKIEGHK